MGFPREIRLDFFLFASRNFRRLPGENEVGFSCGTTAGWSLLEGFYLGLFRSISDELVTAKASSMSYETSLTALTWNACLDESHWPCVLTVGEDVELVDCVQSYLAPYCVKCLRASHGMQAIWLVAVERPHMILWDQTEPEATTGELIDCLAAHPLTSRVPIVSLTRRRDDSVRFSTTSSLRNTVGVIRKPWHREHLLATVARFVPLVKRAAVTQPLARFALPYVD